MSSNAPGSSSSSRNEITSEMFTVEVSNGMTTAILSIERWSSDGPALPDAGRRSTRSCKGQHCGYGNDGDGCAGVRDPRGRRGTHRRQPRGRRAPRRRPRVRAAVLALPAPHLRLHPRHGQGPRPRGGHHAGGLHLRAAPHARDRARDRLQAVGLRDRQERLHRPVPALPARRGGLDGRRATASARPITAASSPATPRPTTRSTPSSSSTTSAAPSAASPTRTTRSSCCASSRASPTARSATAWASAAPASRARSSAPASA